MLSLGMIWLAQQPCGLR